MPDVRSEPEWTASAAAHRARVETFTGPHGRRAQRGEAHPVWDFLFTYYSLRPRQLRVWHPGYGVALAGRPAAQYLARAGYVASAEGVTVGADFLRLRLPTVRFVADLLRDTTDRAPQFGCFGMHEWAMVYRSDAVRHGRVPLRLGAAGTDAVVESMPLRCTHFDAFRFFTDAAAPRNRGVPTRTDQRDWEQPGCLHVNMDLYKWCYKLGPLVDSQLLVDCLELAAQARELDMRASPYDLTDLGFEPIIVEEPGGRAEYVRCQGVISERAAPLRSALLAWCEQLIGRSVGYAAYDGLSEVALPAGNMN
ncbi:3-methyladenine DNA glycosylase [Mycolicibacterium sp. Dal123E01]|uniref:3-methyladenine DNA glycosylase n=1 Tax=Mycolicibacterium sp. Dal123E01 TaxID=3457578 RepID=UPI00403EE0BE